MLFNSPEFIFVFLPVVLVGFFLLGLLPLRWPAAAWLVGASLTFYAWDDPWHLLPIILASAIFNYAIGYTLNRTRSAALLAVGVGVNLGALSYFKYITFLSYNLAALGLPTMIRHVALPIGISFYTFTQIAFLVDTYRGEAREYNILHYILFVSYFPHLVAGPILHHKEMMPQFNLKHIYRFNMNDFLLGISLFSAGLFKKVVFADNLSGYADAVFNSADAGTALTATQAWCGAISYSLQLYFDFSGYSDMAIGLARMVGIRFPLNFFSPYRATSVIEFWRRWHMTLSRFLRDYLYIPLGGNRRGPVLRYVNLLITMVIGGLWHGASWNFIFWGGLHGAALIGNHLWRNLTARWGILTPAIIGQTATLLIVVWAWVPFRAHSLAAALSIWHDMLGLSGLFGAVTWNEIIVLFGLSAIALLTPNTAQLFLDEKRQRPAFSGLRWRSSMAWSIALGAALGIAISSSFTHPSAFLYFRF